MRRRIAISFLGAFQALAQPPTFDVASVKPTGPGITGLDRAIRITPGRLSATFENVMALISKAYDIPTQFISGAPDWATRDPFDIEAKTESPADEVQVKRMLQALLVDRLQLKTRHETKNLPVSSMTIGKHSAMLTPAKEPGISSYAWSPAGVVRGRNMSLPDLAGFLTNLLGQVVIDETGIEGEFDFEIVNPTGELLWTRTDVATVLQRELGLKLETQKGPVETLVIDHVERPSAN